MEDVWYWNCYKLIGKMKWNWVKFLHYSFLFAFLQSVVDSKYIVSINSPTSSYGMILYDELIFEHVIVLYNIILILEQHTKLNSMIYIFPHLIETICFGQMADVKSEIFEMRSHIESFRQYHWHNWSIFKICTWVLKSQAIGERSSNKNQTQLKWF